MKITTYENGMTHEQCKNFKELKDYITEESIVDDEYHIQIAYKDGTFYDSFNTCEMPKMRNIYSCVISGGWGYTTFNADIEVEEDNNESFYYCYVKTVEE